MSPSPPNWGSGYWATQLPPVVITDRSTETDHLQ